MATEASATAGPRAPVGRWIFACTMGEMLGFGAAGGWAWIAWRLFGFDPVQAGDRAGVLGLMVLAGVFEGTALGTLQWVVLRMTFPTIRARDWVGVTMAVAALGWFVGMLPSTLAGAQASRPMPSEPSLPTALALAVAFGAVVGAIFGAAQWLVLRRHARGVWRWIVGNAIGWAAGLPWAYAAGATTDISRATGVAIAVGVLAGALMGLIVAIATSIALQGIFRQSQQAAPTGEGRC